MSKAEEKAQAAYPAWRNGIGDEFNSNSAYYGFIEGYHQAAKDLELTWEDIETIQEMANKYCKYHSCEPRFFVYSEVLKQFKDLKERKEK